MAYQNDKRGKEKRTSSSSDRPPRRGSSKPGSSRPGRDNPKAENRSSSRPNPKKPYDRSAPRSSKPSAGKPAEQKAPVARRRKKVATTPKGLAAQAPEWLLDTQHSQQVSSAKVTELLEKMGFGTDDIPVASLVDHLLLVRQMNQEINLVSRANVDSVLLQSLWESLAPVLQRDRWQRGNKILDLGSGGGFPGLCLAIAMHDVDFMLVDSRRAKTLALTSMVEDLGLKNVTVVHERAENLASHEDVLVDSVVVRAVGVLKEVAPWAERLLKKGGTLLVWKGPEGLREFQALDKEKWSLVDSLPVLPHRSVLVLEHKGGSEE